MTKTLIAFFSMSGESYVAGKLKHLEIGNTQVAANMIASLIDADLYHIETNKAYPSSHMELIEVARKEHEKQARPALANPPASLTSYENIIIAYPNWWGTCPMAVLAFLENESLQNKHLYPLCTHEGSGLANSIADIKRACTQAIIHDGLALVGTNIQTSQPTIEQWLNKNQLK